MRRAWVFNRPVLLQRGLAGEWKPATHRVMTTIKSHLQGLPRAQQLSAFTGMVMGMLKLDSEFHQEGVEQGFVVPIRGSDGAFACCHWQGNRDWI